MIMKWINIRLRYQTSGYDVIVNTTIICKVILVEQYLKKVN